MQSRAQAHSLFTRALSNFTLHPRSRLEIYISLLTYTLQAPFGVKRTEGDSSQAPVLCVICYIHLHLNWNHPFELGYNLGCASMPAVPSAFGIELLVDSVLYGIS